MNLVINISKELYAYIRSEQYDEHLDKRFDYAIRQSVRTGTLLPKGHGRLGDLDALETEMVNGINAGNYEEGYERYPHINDMDDCVDCVKYADTLVEADTEDEQE